MALIDLIAALIGIVFFGHVTKAPTTVPDNALPVAATQNQSVQTAVSSGQTSNTTDASVVKWNQAELKNFAICLSKSNSTMYGAYWCPHCQNQKKEFGNAFEYVTYRECDPKGPNADPEACQKAGIKGYPTWILADGQRLEGEQALEDLSKATKCPL
jgi:hypothetical protein